MVWSLDQGKIDNGRSSATIQQKANVRVHQNKRDKKKHNNNTKKGIRPRFPSLTLECNKTNIHLATRQKDRLNLNPNKQRSTWKLRSNKEDAGSNINLLG